MAGFNDEEIARFQEAFRSMPSYNKEEETISASDFPLLFQAMPWERTKGQIQKYIEQLGRENNGYMTMGNFVRYIRAVHDPDEMLLAYAVENDKDKDGFISDEEFRYMLEILEVHDPTVSAGTYEEFLVQADTNKDGKVSIKELKAWLQKKRQK
jgi:Ca2+-binding EF-hand superfamily protein